ncbi:PepSY domain-containing protein [Leucobacter aridicollis]|uniref:PepSY domain-containing protein n=1 Tax=Leucobacter aridicollis TaxID=283878 RepID=UPI0021076A5F|nr:PepSY domain-containing protein [Leucobacter aridicollis]UTX53703.1 PepSY domain-containing protein [Leucobacter aridicollis]
MRHVASTLTIAGALGAVLLFSGCAPTVTAIPPETSEAPSPSTPEAAPDAGTQDPSVGATPFDVDLTKTEFATSWRDALATGATAFDGEPVSVSFEWNRTVWAYTVKLLSADEVYLATVNADTGEIIGEWTKPRGGGGRAGTPTGVFPADGVIEPSAAIAAALTAAQGTFEEWELEQDNGVLAYEVQIDQGNDDVDVRIDARSGKVLEIDN